MPRYRKSSWRGFDPEAQRPAGQTAAVVAAGAAARCRILGLDPGSVRTGYGLVECDGSAQRFIEAGCIRPPAGSQAQRLHYIHRTLAALVDTHRPDEVAIERVFVARGSMLYSAVTQPVPLPRRCGGTRSSMEAEQITTVLPIEMMAEPSAHFWTPSSIFRSRS